MKVTDLDPQFVKLVLQFDPFDGDFGDPDDREFQDKLVQARKEHDCSWCGAEIRPGELYRSIAGVNDGDFSTWKGCIECCDAFALVESCPGFEDSATIRFAMNRAVPVVRKPGNYKLIWCRELTHGT
jgi:hypothetical protein